MTGSEKRLMGHLAEHDGMFDPSCSECEDRLAVASDEHEDGFTVAELGGEA